MMNIVYVSTSEVPSDRANSIQVMKVSQAIVQLGHALTLLVPKDQPDPLKEGAWDSLAVHYGLSTPFPIEWLPIPSILGRRGYNLIAVRRARKIIAELVYTRSIPAAVLSLLAGIPAALEIHNLPSGTFGPLWFRLFLVLPGKKRLLPLTNALFELLTEQYRITLRDEEVMIAPSGVDLARYESLPLPETARHQLGLPRGMTVACTGHLYSGRGVELFLALAAQHPQYNFLWVGGRSEDVSKWREHAQRENLLNVDFIGFVPQQDVPLYQASADVLLLPYQSVVAVSGGGDTSKVFSSLKQFEYMAAGRAILASDLPVVRETLDENLAVLCPPDDLEAWSKALKCLLTDQRQRQTLASNARIEAARYSWLERARRSLETFKE